MITKPTEEEAQRLLDYICSLDPAWRERVIALQEERRCGALRTIAILVCNTLESGNHMAIPVIEQLADDYIPSGTTVDCPECGNPYTLAYPGQPYCGNECADKARGVERKVNGLPHPIPTQQIPAHIEPEDEALLALAEADKQLATTSLKERRKAR